MKLEPILEVEKENTMMAKKNQQWSHVDNLRPIWNHKETEFQMNDP